MRIIQMDPCKRLKREPNRAAGRSLENRTKPKTMAFCSNRAVPTEAAKPFPHITNATPQRLNRNRAQSRRFQSLLVSWIIYNDNQVASHRAAVNQP